MTDEEWVEEQTKPMKRCTLCRKYPKVSKRLDELLDLMDKKNAHIGFKPLAKKLTKEFPLTYDVDPRTFFNHQRQHKTMCRSKNE